MNSETTSVSVVFGLCSAAVWGVGDFSGGMATRRAPVLTVLLISQMMGVLLMIALGVINREILPSLSDVVWAAAAGLFGIVGMFGFYRAMAIGQVGIAAPMTGLVSAIIPMIVGIFLQGVPSIHKQIGFVLALGGVWLISRPTIAQGNRPTGLGLALLGGIGFGMFYVLLAQTKSSSLFWPLVITRTAAIVAMLIVATARRQFTPLLPSQNLLLPLLTGAMDAGGSAFFLLSKQAGRLDVASVLSSLYPATTVLLALVILRERLARWQAIGVVLALAAAVLIALEL